MNYGPNSRGTHKKRTEFPVFSTWSFQSMLSRMDGMNDSDSLGICHNDISCLDEH